MPEPILENENLEPNDPAEIQPTETTEPIGNLGNGQKPDPVGNLTNLQRNPESTLKAYSNKDGSSVNINAPQIFGTNLSKQTMFDISGQGGATKNPIGNSTLTGDVTGTISHQNPNNPYGPQWSLSQSLSRQANVGNNRTVETAKPDALAQSTPPGEQVSYETALSYQQGNASGEMLNIKAGANTIKSTEGPSGTIYNVGLGAMLKPTKDTTLNVNTNGDFGIQGNDVNAEISSTTKLGEKYKLGLNAGTNIISENGGQDITEKLGASLDYKKALGVHLGAEYKKGDSGNQTSYSAGVNYNPTDQLQLNVDGKHINSVSQISSLSAGLQYQTNNNSIFGGTTFSGNAKYTNTTNTSVWNQSQVDIGLGAKVPVGKNGGTIDTGVDLNNTMRRIDPQYRVAYSGSFSNLSPFGR